MVASRLQGHWIYDEEKAKRERQVFEMGYERGYEDAGFQAGDGRLIALFLMAACVAAFIFGCAVGGAF